jgi:hypothetical protein
MGTAAKPTGTRIQTWVPLDLTAELKQHADRERRSVRAVVRNAVSPARSWSRPSSAKGARLLPQPGGFERSA